MPAMPPHQPPGANGHCFLKGHVFLFPPLRGWIRGHVPSEKETEPSACLTRRVPHSRGLASFGGSRHRQVSLETGGQALCHDPCWRVKDQRNRALPAVHLSSRQGADRPFWVGLSKC